MFSQSSQLFHPGSPYITCYTLDKSGLDAGLIQTPFTFTAYLTNDMSKDAKDKLVQELDAMNHTGSKRPRGEEQLLDKELGFLAVCKDTKGEIMACVNVSFRGCPDNQFSTLGLHSYPRKPNAERLLLDFCRQVAKYLVYFDGFIRMNVAGESFYIFNHDEVPLKHRPYY